MDLEDVEESVKYGCHIASFGGSWMFCVYGLAGMRDLDGNLSFNPKLPRQVRRLHFPLTIRGQVLEVTVEQDSFTFHLREGSQLRITCQGQEIDLTRGSPATVKNNPEN